MTIRQTKAFAPARINKGSAFPGGQFMTSTASIKLIPCLMALVLCAFHLAAGDSAIDRQTLRGLKAIRVVVERPSQEMEHEGLTRDQLQSNVEKQLRTAGINIDDNVNEFIGLSMVSAGIKRGPLNVAFNLSFYQGVTLNRNKAINAAVAETWSVLGVQSSPPKLLAEVSQGTVTELVEQFIRAYREVSPK